jgi:hypothetical protein
MLTNVVPHLEYTIIWPVLLGHIKDFVEGGPTSPNSEVPGGSAPPF